MDETSLGVTFSTLAGSTVIVGVDVYVPEGLLVR